MKLSAGTLRPGIVREILEDGKIRASAPGLFNVQDLSKYPPILPFWGNHANSYSSPKLLDEVWVLNFEDNPQQFHWFRMDKFTENSKALMKEPNVDILCNRESGSNWATLYFSDKSGWIIRKDQGTIQIRPNGTIKLDINQPHRTIDINGSNISLGSEGKSEHPAAYGDVLTEILEDISSALNAIRQAAAQSPYTTPISTALKQVPEELDKKIPKVTSPHVTLD